MSSSQYSRSGGGGRRPSGSSIGSLRSLDEASIYSAASANTRSRGGRPRTERRSSLRMMAAAMEAKKESDTQRLHSLHAVEKDAEEEEDVQNSLMRARLAVADDDDDEESYHSNRNRNAPGVTAEMHHQYHPQQQPASQQQQQQQQGGEEESGMVKIETQNGEHVIAQNSTSGHNVVHISVPEYDPDDDLDDVLFDSVAYRQQRNKMLKNNKKKSNLVGAGGGVEHASGEFPGDFPIRSEKPTLSEFVRSKTCYKLSVALAIVITILIATIIAILSKKSFDVPTPPTDNDPNAPPPLNVELSSDLEAAYAEWFDLNGLQPGVSATPSQNIRDDVPLYWSIPLSANLIMEDVMGSCYDLIQAAEVGIVDGHDADDSLKIVQVYGSSYANVDVTTKSGISRAVSMKLIPANIVDVLHTPLLHDATSLFTRPTITQGRVFTILRHPIDRATAIYKYLHESRFEQHEEVSTMTLEDYARSDFVENNWLTRFLSNKKSEYDELTEYDVKVAKEILRRKVLVGMYDDIVGALELFQSHFHWNDGESNFYSADSLVGQCVGKLAQEGSKKEERWNDPPVEEGSVVWNLLMEQNKYDMDLFLYARALSQYQVAKIMGRRKRGLLFDDGEMLIEEEEEEEKDIDGKWDDDWFFDR